MPPLTDFVALLCMDLVLCAGLLRLLARWPACSRLAPWAALALALLLWLPAGQAELPLLAYVRGVSSDLSVTLVALAALGAWLRLSGQVPVAPRERLAVSLAIGGAAIFLYPLALGWGDWDAYRLGWGSPWLLAALGLLVGVCWLRGLRLLPALVGLALLAWSAGLLESSNMWDYLIDPWLAVAALFTLLKSLAGRLRSRFGKTARRVS
jgi:hypothetical protein